MRDTRAVVLGLGHFGGGLGAARWLARQGARVLVTDKSGPEELARPVAQLAPYEVELALGGHDAVDWAAADLVVVNPAVPLDAPPVVAARRAGAVITSEMALLMEHWPGPVLGVTGSNGKSTTAALAHGLLTAARVPSVLGGNIGGSLLDRVDEAGPRETAVVELSSFMLEVLDERGLGPDVAIVSNITPNHLDRHGTFDAYRRAKAAILGRARYAVLFREDAAVRALGEDFHGQVFWFGSEGHMVVRPSGDIVDRFGSVLLDHTCNPLPGRMNALNLAAALLGAAAVTGDELRVNKALPRALESFRMPPQRLELVGNFDGVRWINDSVSTTPESTGASLAAMGGRCILLAGGRDKGLDPSPLIEAARDHVRLAITVGEQGLSLARGLQAAGLQAESVGTVAAAVARAAKAARAGEVVLFSPGYSSHDQFTHFRQRGDVFVREVRRAVGAEPLAVDVEEK